MKFIQIIAFFALVTTVSAITTVVLSGSSKCTSSGASHAITKCGTNVLPNPGKNKAALITDNEEGVIFYRTADCTGKGHEVKGNKCYNLKKLGFQAKCLSIVCVSCHIIILLYYLFWRDGYSPSVWWSKKGINPLIFYIIPENTFVCAQKYILYANFFVHCAVT